MFKRFYLEQRSIPLSSVEVLRIARSSGYSARFVTHESLSENMTCEDLLRGNDCCFILLNVIHNGMPSKIGHWSVLLKNAEGLHWYQSYKLTLRELYNMTHEKPILLHIFGLVFG